jgi:DNA-binding response OmpR family regulator
MMAQKFILIISRDRILQHTRRLILERHGYRVFDVHTDDEAINAVAASAAYSLVLLCHSVPEKSRLLLVDKIKELQPSLPILMLYNSYDPTEAKVDGSLHSLDSPAALLDMIAVLTQETRSTRAS